MLLPFPDVGNNSVQIMVESSGVPLAGSANLLYNGVFEHGHASISSSGVQMTGQTKPASSRKRSTCLRMVALAK